jgi:hypothetical protein
MLKIISYKFHHYFDRVRFLITKCIFKIHANIKTNDKTII